MKKKITTMLLVIVCAFCCVIGLVACNNNKECIGIVVESPENSSEKTNNVDLGKYVYGEDDKINADLAKLKFFKKFDDNTYEAISASKLNVKYGYGVNTTEDKPKPDKFYCYDGNPATYSFKYSLSGTQNTVQVTLEVQPAISDEFSITLSKTQWKYGEKSATVTLKNFDGTVMQESGTGLNMKKDDTEYSGLSLYAMKKDYYAELSETAKNNYDMFTTTESDETKPNHGYNKYFGKNLMSYQADAEYDIINLSTGEYVLIACVGSTHNYTKIVCTADFTVTAPDSPIGKTFVLTDLTAYIYEGGERKPVPDEEVMYMAAALKKDNLGKTAVCSQDGKVTGTCDFGFGAFDELTGEEAFTITFDPERLTVEIANKEDMRLSGEYQNQTLTLSVQQQTDGDTPIQYYFGFTFELKTEK